MSSNSTFRWTRLIPTKWEDSWLERLKGEPTVLTTLPNSRSARLDVYCSSQRKAQSFLKYFGGKVSLVKDSEWKTCLEGSCKPISIRGKLVIYSNETAFCSHTAQTIPLFSPAEMAFGSGAHITTASCLRILCDLQREQHKKWKFLDLGTGSGILAIAASALGAEKVLAIDFDPIAIRTARRNLHRNRANLKKSKVPRFQKMDIREDYPVGKYDVVCANLFSELLIGVASRIFHSLESGGWWIFSGILANQMPEVALAIQKAGFSQPTIRQQGGKWVTGFSQKPD